MGRPGTPVYVQREVDGCYSNLTFQKSRDIFGNMYLSDCGSSGSGSDLFGVESVNLGVLREQTLKNAQV